MAIEKTFENYVGKDFMRKGSDVIYRFATLHYGVGQEIEIVGEHDTEGFMFAFNDPDKIMAQIEKGDLEEVSEVAELH